MTDKPPSLMKEAQDLMGASFFRDDEIVETALEMEALGGECPTLLGKSEIETAIEELEHEHDSAKQGILQALKTISSCLKRLDTIDSRIGASPEIKAALEDACSSQMLLENKCNAFLSALD